MGEQQMNICITGAAGFIGSILTPLLVKHGYNVTALDAFVYGNETTLAALCKHPNFDMYRVDVRDERAWRQFTAKADVIIPLAGLVGAPACDLRPFEALALNLDHPLALVKSLAKDQLCVMPTTESAYGSNAEVCTEETPTNPLSSYGKHKAIVERALLDRENSISLRLATVFGMSPRMRLDLLVNDFAWKAYREHSILLFEEHYKRTVLHVEDAATAFIHAIQNRGAMRGEIYNIGNVTLTKRGLCEAIKVKMPDFYFATISKGSDPDQRNYEVSSAKLKRTGYEFRWTLDAGLDELFKGFRALTNTRWGNV
jgi:nucleoside-diphosphate-sugar epimerase